MNQEIARLKSTITHMTPEYSRFMEEQRRRGILEAQEKYSADIEDMLYEHKRENLLFSYDCDHEMFMLLDIEMSAMSTYGLWELVVDQSYKRNRLDCDQSWNVTSLLMKHDREMKSLLQNHGQATPRELHDGASELMRTHSREKWQLLKEHCDNASKLLMEYSGEEERRLKARSAKINELLISQVSRMESLQRAHSEAMDTRMQAYNSEMRRLLGRGG